MSRDDTHFRLRIPPDLKEYIRACSLANQRSMNGEIIFALRQQQAASGASQG